MIPVRSRIAARLLAFNLLLLFLPVAAILYLDVYEARLLDSQERSMNQQARILAVALGHENAIDPMSADDLLNRLQSRPDARLRIYDRSGALVADSNRVKYSAESPVSPSNSSVSARIRERALYRLGAWIAGMRATVDRIARRLGMRTDDPSGGGEAGSTPAEVRAALAGRYGAATRPTPGQRSLTLSIAVPIYTGNTVSGVVLVSQSTFRVLQALYQVRLRIFEVVIGSLVAALLLTTLAAATVVRPLQRLRDEASALAERRHRLPGAFPDVTRRDELGDLARALAELTKRLNAYIHEGERFAADVSHEFRNPLASIRVAAETALHSDDPAERQRFLLMLIREVDRLERLVAAVREQTRMDARLDQEPVEDVEIETIVSEVIDGLKMAEGNKPDVQLTIQASCCVRGSRDRLARAFENILNNARSFAPEGTLVEVRVSREIRRCRIEIADRGPGIPPEHTRRIFERFFSYRPNLTLDPETHTGLGLSIARTIVESYGGTIAANNRTDGPGARFAVELPVAEG